MATQWPDSGVSVSLWLLSACLFPFGGSCGEGCDEPQVGSES